MARFYSDEFTDRSFFRSRLWKLMEDNGIESARDLAGKLYDEGLIKPSQRKESFDYESRIRYNAINTISKAIEAHLASDGPEKLQGEYLTAYCKFFGCSADYLLGFIDNPTHVSTDVEAVTGLSDHSIQHIVNDMNNGQREVLDAIIRTGGIEGIYGALYNWFYLTTYEGENPIPSEMQEDASGYVAEKSMRKVFDSLSADKSIRDHFTIGIMEDLDLSDIWRRASDILTNNPPEIDLSQALKDIKNTPIDPSQAVTDAMNKRKFRNDNKNS